MRFALIILTTVMILTTLVSAAQAQRSRLGQMPRGERWDFTIQTRYTSANDYSGNGGSSVAINADLGWGFGFGYNFNQHFNLGLLFTWRSVPYQSEAVDAEDPTQTSRYSGTMSTSTFGLSGEYNVLKGPLTPYVNASLGWMHINSNIFAGWTSGCWWDPWWGYRCGPVPLTYGANETAYTLGLGGRFEVSSSVFLRAGYERGWIGSSTVDGSDMMRIDIGFMF
jgi:opacity protein-like surface antigen